MRTLIHVTFLHYPLSVSFGDNVERIHIPVHAHGEAFLKSKHSLKRPKNLKNHPLT